MRITTLSFNAAIGLICLSLMGCIYRRTASTSKTEDHPVTRLLVFGDMQPAFDMAKVMSQNGKQISLSKWRQSLSVDDHLLGAKANDPQIDTSASLRLATLIRSFAPDQILQTGDLVDWNDGLQLLVTQNGLPSPALHPSSSEWSILRFFPDPNVIFPTTGNHEAIKNVEFDASQSSATNDWVDVTGQSSTQNKSQDRHDLLITHFPQVDHDSTWIAGTATYFHEFPAYCLLSIDGNDLVSLVAAGPTGEALVQALDPLLGSCGTRLPTDFAKPIIVMTHLPIFAGGKEVIPGSLRKKMVELFNLHHVSLVLNGHEHHYLRYAPQWLDNIGMGDVTPWSAYATIGCFANPYIEKTKAEVLAVKRLDLSANQLHLKQGADVSSFVYLPFHHYGSIELNGASLTLTVYAADPAFTGQWNMIDRVTVTRPLE